MPHGFRDIGPTALPSLDLQRLHTRRSEILENFAGAEAGWLFEEIAGKVADLEPALAEGRIAGLFFRAEYVDGRAAEARDHAAIALLVADMARRGADALAVGRLAGDIGRQRAAAFRHGAHAAEGK